ncbi:uncharacterized protein LOC108093687 [Drosophila ficusphila]|uniref:uncharacterized protein LOC108093687 n=1 Tax=Drosophila ficusphila TaxID=30025 RepID=UPI0007E8233F|nr:uncharacterized protein LOC108093687 [Drosophila ficusphila]
MSFKYLLCFLLVFLFLTQVQAELNATSNATDVQKNVTIRHVMVRKLHGDAKKGSGMMHVVVHKVQPGHPYYKVFDDNEEAARGFTNKIWNRLFNRYSTMRI